VTKFRAIGKLAVGPKNREQVTPLTLTKEKGERKEDLKGILPEGQGKNEGLKSAALFGTSSKKMVFGGEGRCKVSAIWSTTSLEDPFLGQARGHNL